MWFVVLRIPTSSNNHGLSALIHNLPAFGQLGHALHSHPGEGEIKYRSTIQCSLICIPDVTVRQHVHKKAACQHS